MIYILDFRGANVGGPVVPGRIVQIGGLAAGTEDDLRLEPKITFLLHGYNVDREQGRESLRRLAERLPSSGGAPVAVLWPGDHWSGHISYSFEGNDADDTGAELARFIDRAIARGTELSFVTHSLGARVALECVKRLIGGGYRIGQICLLAAAIDDFSLARSGDYRLAVAEARRVAVLASRKDRVLKLAYPAGDLLQAFVFFWKETSGLALGYHGPRAEGADPIPSQVYHHQIPDQRNSDHGDYLPGAAPTANQLSAARFADEVLAGAVTPGY